VGLARQVLFPCIVFLEHPIRKRYPPKEERMNTKIFALATLLSFGYVAAAQAADPAPTPTPAPQEKKDEKKTDKAPEKKDDAKGGAPVAGEKK
jgi:hypothetical protein